MGEAADIYSIKTIERADQLDQGTLQALYYLTLQLPSTSKLHGSPHTQIDDFFQDYLSESTSPAAVMIAERPPLGRPMAFMGIRLDEGSADVTQLAVVPEAPDGLELANLLVERGVEWGSEHNAQKTTTEHAEFIGTAIGHHVLKINPPSDPELPPGAYLG